MILKLQFIITFELIIIKFYFTEQHCIKYNNAKRSIPAHPTFVNDAHCDLHLWPVTSKINWVHPHMPAKFNEEARSVYFKSIVFTSLFPYMYMSSVNLTFDLQNQ